MGMAIHSYALKEPLFPAVYAKEAEIWRTRLGCLGREAAVGTVMRLLWPLGRLPEGLPREDDWDGNHRPILLIHGYMQNRTCMWPLQWWLQQKGFTVLTFDHDQISDSIETKAAKLRSRVELLLKVLDIQKLDLVCHSMGGLVARYYVENMGGAAYIDKVITLGTPHRGTGMAVFARGKLAQQMLPESGLLSQLPCPTSEQSTVKYTAIAGGLDTVVFPVQSALLGPPHEDRLLQNVGHNSLIMHREAFLTIRDALLEGRPSATLPLETP